MKARALVAMRSLLMKGKGESGTSPLGAIDRALPRHYGGA